MNKRLAGLLVILMSAWLLAAGIIAQDETDTPPAILAFDYTMREKGGVDLQEDTAITLDRIERGELEIMLSWTVLDAFEGYYAQLETYRARSWEPVLKDDDDPEARYGVNDRRTLDLLHPLNFGPPTYRLLLLRDNGELIEQRVLTVPYDHDPVFSERPHIAELTAPLTMDANVLDAIPVSWQVENRWPLTNLVFEQVLANGGTMNAELPRATMWIASEGAGVLRAVPPSAGNAIVLRLRVVDMRTGETYDQAGVLVAVTGESEQVQSVTGTREAPLPTVPADSPQTTIDTGETPDDVTGDTVTAQGAFQPFEDGFMIWNSAWGSIWVLTNSGRAYFYPQENYAGLPDNPIREQPPDDLFMPVRGFGKVWGNYVNVRAILGWALAEETGYTIDIKTEVLPRTRMVVYTANLPDGTTIEVRSDGTWDVAGSSVVAEPTVASDARAVSFTALPEIYRPGDALTLNWEVVNADSVILEAYEIQGPDSPASNRPFERMQNLPLSGSLSYAVPQTFEIGIRFVLIAVVSSENGTPDLIPVAEAESLNAAEPVAETSETSGAYQPFEGGFMLWRGDNGTIYVLLKDGEVLVYPESSYASLPENPVAEQPPTGRVRPVSGFGKVWGNFEAIRDALGWALGMEQGFTMVIAQNLPDGLPGDFTLSLPDGRRVLIRADLTWAIQ